MKERSEWIDKLTNNYDSRVAYIKSKISINVPSQIKALRRRQGLTQGLLAQEANMKQSRISAIEYPGGVSFTVETLTRLAAAFKVGLVIKFVPFSEMLRWENSYSQDSFDVAIIDKDHEFIEPQDILDSLHSANKPNIIEAAFKEHYRGSPLVNILNRETHGQPRPVSVSGLMETEMHTPLHAGIGGR